MPLGVTLQADMQALLLSSQPDFATAAEAWADVAATYFSGVVGPIVDSQDAARTAFRDTFLEEFGGDLEKWDEKWPALAACWQAYADQLAADATNTPDEVLAPPVSPVFAVSASSTAQATATNVATVVDVWAKTGSVVPPSGTPVLWS